MSFWERNQKDELRPPRERSEMSFPADEPDRPDLKAYEARWQVRDYADLESTERFEAWAERLGGIAKLLKTMMPEVASELEQGSIVIHEMTGVIHRLDDRDVVCPEVGTLAQGARYRGETEGDCTFCGKHFVLDHGRYPCHTVKESRIRDVKARLENY